ncbi:hypothetical protein QJS04_geneDACA007668 [Acorus gramineus]|uniref:Bifunctional inhibitor/plant lipid transfer protein/seed storage helical domain-containing protein n=1 Tax=Acorus gramineus TaxID=55184 RepID=A0AAV9B1C5_ACOGR|nr:hypothetical protein QJS04_geneDACA007668 [Acorus gramineus]
MKKIFCFLVILLIAIIVTLEKADGAGECGRSPANSIAMRLAPCAMASQEPQASVNERCCQQVKIMGQNPSCLCAVLLSDTAKYAGVKPEVAITIPKRCNIADRPVGYRCGGE